MLLDRLKEVWGGKDERECASKLKKAARTISGGVELG